MKHSYLLLATLCSLPAFAGDQPTPDAPRAAVIERNIDRPGYDYRNFNLSRQAWILCADACALDARCKAWTYVRAGIQGPQARCWLKWRVPARRYSDCCTSGVK